MSKILLLISLFAVLGLQVEAKNLQFLFGQDRDLSPDGTAVYPEDRYSIEKGYGFEYADKLKTVHTASGTGIQSSGPTVFSVALAEGNYDVELTLLGGETEGLVTIKTESRRLAIESESIPANAERTLRFTVNVRTEKLADGGSVALKSREVGTWHWDERLQIEINGENLILGSLEVAPNHRSPTIYLAGDSTVTDQPEEPWIGWGQMLPRFFQPGIAVSNHAESGLAYSTFHQQRRLDKILDTIRPGDYLLLQFGHNDMKQKGEGIGPWESYTRYIEEFVAAARSKGAKPILITAMKRRRFDKEGRQFGTHGEYLLAVRQTAQRLEVPLIDLNLMSGVLYGALGPEDSKKAFVHYPAGTFPGQERELKDDTHFNAYGGYELARCVVEGLKLTAPELIPYLDPELAPYDPSYPDPIDAIKIPPSPMRTFNKPDGD